MQPYIQTIIDQANQAAEFCKGQSNQLLTPFTFDLNSSGSQQITLQGNFIYVIDATDGSAHVDIQFNRESANTAKLTLVKNLGYEHPFLKVYFSWIAQAGKTMTVLLGAQAGELMSVIDNRSAADAGISLASIVTNTANTATNTADTVTAVNALSGNIDDIADNTRVLSPDTGTQIIKDGAANNTTTTIHTVTAGKTFYLCGYDFNIYSTTAGLAAELFVTDAANVLQYKLSRVNTITATFGAQKEMVFIHPVKIPAGYKIKLISSGAGNTNDATINGWEE